MTEGQVQGKWVLVRNNGKFVITEFELAGSNCTEANVRKTGMRSRLESRINHTGKYLNHETVAKSITERI